MSFLLNSLQFKTCRHIRYITEPQFKTFFHVWKIIMKLTRFDCCMASCFYIDSEKNCLRSRIYHFRSFLLSCSCLFTTFTPFSCQTIHWWKLIRLFIPIQYSTASWRLKIAFSIFWQVTHGLMEKMSWKTHEYLNTFVSTSKQLIILPIRLNSNFCQSWNMPSRT